MPKTKTIFKLSGKSPEINNRLPELVAMRESLTKYFVTEFYNPDGVEGTLTEWLRLLLDDAPRSLGATRAAAASKNLAKFGVSKARAREIIQYDRLRSAIICANKPMAIYAVDRCKWRNAIGHDDAITIALQELTKAVDRIDPSKSELSTYAITCIGLTLDRYAQRHLSGFAGLRKYQDMYSLAVRHHRKLLEFWPDASLDRIGAELTGSMDEWEKTKRGTRPPELLQLNEQLIGA